MTEKKHYPMPEMSEQERADQIKFLLADIAKIEKQLPHWMGAKFTLPYLEGLLLSHKIALAELTAPKPEPIGYIDPASLKEYRGVVAGGSWSGKPAGGEYNQTLPIYTVPPVPALNPIKTPGTKCIGWVKEAIHEHDEKWISAIRAAGYEVKNAD